MFNKLFSKTEETLSKYSIPNDKLELSKQQLNSSILYAFYEKLIKASPNEDQKRLKELIERFEKNPDEASADISAEEKEYFNTITSKYLPIFVENELQPLLEVFDKSLKEYLEENAST